MLLIYFSILLIAVSLPYYSLSSIFSRVFWKRISIISLVITILIFVESFTIDINSTTVLYNGLFNHSLQNTIFIGTILFSGLFLSTLGSSISKPFGLNIETIYLDTRDRERLIFVFSLIVGGIILSGASDLLTVFLGLELQSYSAYILAASYRNSEPSEAAGLKYFLLGGLSSALIFMGLALLYVYTGNLDLGLGPIVLSALDRYDINIIMPYIGAILLLIGFLWKIAAAPLQAWSIDVYDAVPTRTTAILSILPKIGLIGFIVKLLYDITSLANLSLIVEKGFSINVLNINFIIYVVIALSLIIGSVYGIFQPRIKRLLAYSSVLNIGFILMGSLLINYGQFDSFNPLFYLIQYVISTITIWLCLTSIEKVSLIEVITTSQLQGLGNNLVSTKSKFNPVYLGISLTILILSTAGIPPMIGFFAKYEIILLSLKTDYFSLSLLAIIASLVSTYYYLNIVKNIWFKGFKSNELSLSTLDLTAYGQNFKEESRYNLNELIGISSLIPFLTLGILLFTLQYSVIYIFITLTF